MHAFGHFLAHPALLKHAGQGALAVAKHAPAAGKFALKVGKRVLFG